MGEQKDDEWLNYKGERVRREDAAPSRPEYVKSIGPKGRWVPNCDLLNDDEYVFFRHVNIAGEMSIKVKLPRGTKFLRYGAPDGHYTAPLGSEYERLSLPYKKESIPYNEYEVTAEWLEVEWGYTALGFDSIDRCIQYYNEVPVNVLKEKGTIKKIMRGTIV